MNHLDKQFGHRIDLREPERASTAGLEGHDLRSISIINDHLDMVFAGTESDLPKVLVQVRADLRLSIEQLAEKAGISSNGYRPMEKDKVSDGHDLSHRVKYTNVMDVWRESGIPEGVREQCLDLLTQPDIGGFYHRIGYDIGHEEFERQFPGFFNTLWQRNKTGAVGSLLEVRNIVSTLYKTTARSPDWKKYRLNLRLQQGRDAWKRSKSSQLSNRGIEQPLATLLTVIEQDLAEHHGVTFTAAALRDAYGLGPLAAQRLLQCDFTEWEDVEAIASKLCAPDDVETLRKSWLVEHEREKSRVTLERAVNGLLEESKLTATDVAKFIGVKPPEERIKGYSVERRHRYRADNEVRRALSGEGASSQVAIDAVIAVVTAERPELQEELVRLHAEDRTRYYRRSGSMLHGQGLDMRILRERAGVQKMSELAEVLLPDKSGKKELRRADLSLQRLERQEGGARAFTFEEAERELRRIADRKVAEALRRYKLRNEIPDELKEHTTITDMANNAILAVNGAKTVSRLLEESGARDEKKWIRCDQISRMSEGLYVPSLPTVYAIHQSIFKETLPEDIRADWYARYPDFLRRRKTHPVKHPLGRVLGTIVAGLDGDHAKFYSERYTRAAPSKASQDFFRLQRYGEVPTERFLHGTLLAAGIEEHDISWQLAQVLLKARASVSEAVASVRDLLEERNLDPTPVNLVGLTEQEIEKGLKK